jgi:hypothetical protein
VAGSTAAIDCVSFGRQTSPQCVQRMLPENIGKTAEFYADAMKSKIRPTESWPQVMRIIRVWYQSLFPKMALEWGTLEDAPESLVVPFIVRQPDNCLFQKIPAGISKKLQALRIVVLHIYAGGSRSSACCVQFSVLISKCTVYCWANERSR